MLRPLMLLKLLLFFIRVHISILGPCHHLGYSLSINVILPTYFIRRHSSIELILYLLKRPKTWRSQTWLRCEDENIVSQLPTFYVLGLLLVLTEGLLVLVDIIHKPVLVH